jgi:bifunctional non-homologous end joining protein LigD
VAGKDRVHRLESDGAIVGHAKEAPDVIALWGQGIEIADGLPPRESQPLESLSDHIAVYRDLQFSPSASSCPLSASGLRPAQSIAVPTFSRFIPPCQPTLRPAPPRGPGWSHEVKFDGWRLQLHKAGTRVRLLSRHGHDLTSTFPTIASAVATLDATTAILDGELVATNAQGVPDFRALQRRSADTTLAVWVFDLLEANGRDARALSLEERRQHLAQQLASCPNDGTLRYSESFDDPARLLAAAHDLGLEGVVSKRLDAPYRSRRPEWVKVKTESWRVANRERWRLFERPSDRHLKG